MAWPVTCSDSWLTHHKVEVMGCLVLTAPHFSPQPSQAEFHHHRAALGSSQTSAASHPIVSHPTLPLCGQLGVYPLCLPPFLPLMSVTLIFARSPPLCLFSLLAVLGVPCSRKPSWVPGRLPLPAQNSIQVGSSVAQRANIGTGSPVTPPPVLETGGRGEPSVRCQAQGQTSSPVGASGGIRLLWA